MPNPIHRLGFGLTFFVLLLTGFAQMPIFKRYYIADIPGLGWLAQFYVTHIIHYICAVIFIVWVCYSATTYLLKHKRSAPNTVASRIQAVLLLGIIATGFMLVIRNFPGHRFSQGIIIALDVTHLVFALVYLIVVGTLRVLKRKSL